MRLSFFVYDLYILFPVRLTCGLNVVIICGSTTKKGSKYLRKTLYQIITPVIENNKVFKDYYNLKRSQGKSHRCAQGHCVRKLLRVIFHLLTTNQKFDPALLK